MNAYYKGHLITGPRGPAGPDGNLVGTIISFIGLTSPADYLICDGVVYNVSDHPELAAFVQQQFGSANHFGGDGETTFAVPDMRNLFIRGYHGEAEEQLSGEIGQRQEATKHPYVYGPNQSTSGYIAYGNIAKNALNFPENYDNTTSSTQHAQIIQSAAAADWLDRSKISGEAGKVYNDYSSRPVNMAVLYCIKTVEGVPAENVYSTEGTRIGTWIDGKPLYRKTLILTSPSNNDWLPVYQDTEIGFVVKEYGILKVRSLTTPRSGSGGRRKKPYRRQLLNRRRLRLRRKRSRRRNPGLSRSRFPAMTVPT